MQISPLPVAMDPGSLYINKIRKAQIPMCRQFQSRLLATPTGGDGEKTPPVISAVGIIYSILGFSRLLLHRRLTGSLSVSGFRTSTNNYWERHDDVI